MHIPSYVYIVVIASVITLHAADTQQQSNKRTAAQCSPAAAHLSPSVIRYAKLQRLGNDESPLVGCHAWVYAESPQVSQFSETSSDDEEESELREMVELGNLAEVEELIKKGADVKKYTKSEGSLLYSAVLMIGDPKLREQMIELLRKAGAPEHEDFKSIMKKLLLQPLPQSAVSSAL